MSLISVASEVKPYAQYGLIANVVSDHVLRHGAKVNIIATHGDSRNCEVIGLSKGGRRVFKHVAWKRLTNVRAAWLPERIGKHTYLWWDNKEAANKIAAELNALWKGVRVFHPDGTLLQDGISTGEAFKQRRSAQEAKYHEIADIEPIEQRIKEIRAERGWHILTAVPSEWDVKMVMKSISPLTGINMLKRIDSFVKHNTDILEPLHFDAALAIGQKITAAWKVNGDQLVVQIDGREDRLYHWDQNKWVEFTPISLTPTTKPS